MPSADPVLFIDDEPDNLALVRLHLEPRYQLVTATGAAEAFSALDSRAFAAVFSDERMPEMTGIELLEVVAERWPQTMRVIVSAYSDSSRLLSAINRAHVHQYLVKPCSSAVLQRTVDQCLQQYARLRSLSIKAELGEQLSHAASPSDREPMIGWSQGLAGVASRVRKIAASPAPVLLMGETGTGKEIIARTIHSLSERKSGPFLAVNCGAISENLVESELFGHERGAFTGAATTRKGKFELAAGGTLFLDEIGDISLRAQVALLRVLQERVLTRVGGNSEQRVDVRVVAATHRDLPAMVSAGTFREDLFYRLAVLPIAVPPLRERLCDLKSLVDHFVDKWLRTSPYARAPTVSEDLLRFLLSYRWPGNVRELENFVQRALTLCDGETLTVDDFTFREFPGTVESARSDAGERDRDELRALVASNGGNLSAAARSASVARSTLVSRLKKHGLLA